jgi:hypothetical protein
MGKDWNDIILDQLYKHACDALSTAELDKESVEVQQEDKEDPNMDAQILDDLLHSTPKQTTFGSGSRIYVERV